MLRTLLERIAIALGKNREDYYRALSNSFLISADMAHALHPNYTEKQDLTNKPIINGGPTIKISARQSILQIAFLLLFIKAYVNPLMFQYRNL